MQFIKDQSNEMKHDQYWTAFTQFQKETMWAFLNKAFNILTSCLGTHIRSVYTGPHFFLSLCPVSPWWSLSVPVCPWRHGSRSPPLTGQRWTSQGWHSPPAGWYTHTHTGEWENTTHWHTRAFPSFLAESLKETFSSLRSKFLSRVFSPFCSLSHPIT